MASGGRSDDDDDDEDEKNNNHFLTIQGKRKIEVYVAEQPYSFS